MSKYISITIQHATSPATTICHNEHDRDKVDYLVTPPKTATTHYHDLKNINSSTNKDDIYNYFKLRKFEIGDDYKQNNNNRTMQQNTKLYQEAVISFGREQFEENNQESILKNIEKFCIEFEQKYGCKILMSSLHLDEGHKDENNKILHNYHAHILIENYSFATHKTCLQKLDYRKLQTELAECFSELGFVRGDPEKKAVRLEHREYRQMKEQETALVKPLEKEINLKNQNITQLVGKINLKDQLIADFETKLAQKDMEITQLEKAYNQLRADLKASGEAKQRDYQHIKKEFELVKNGLNIGIEKVRQLEWDRGQLDYKEKLTSDNPTKTKFIDLHASNPVYKKSNSRIETNLRLSSQLDTLEKLFTVREQVHEVVVEKKVEKVIEVPKYVTTNVDLTAQMQDENQRLLLLVEKAKLENEKKTTELERTKIQLHSGDTIRSHLFEENKQLNQKVIQLKEENNTLSNRLATLEIDFKALFRAVERFLNLDIIKDTRTVFSSLITGLKSVGDGLKNIFETHQTENLNLKAENQELRKQLEMSKETKPSYQQEPTPSHEWDMGGR
jgi:hypothetical protein